MPDVVNYQYDVPSVNNSIGDLSAPVITANPQTSADIGLNGIAQSYADLLKKQPVWDKQEILNQPYKTRLNDTLRYTDPNIGFNPFDNKLEYKYADAHPWKTLGNNLLQFGARFLGAATEAIATIPLALSGENLYDNDVTNGINEWLDGLNNSLPTYRTEYETNHPFLKYLSFWKPSSLLGAWGGAVNNLGYTVGAFTGSYLGFMPLTALGNAFKLTKLFGTFGRAVATDAASVGNEARTILGIERSAATETGLIRMEGAVVPQGEAAAKGLYSDFKLAEGAGLPSQALPQIGKTLAARSVNTLDQNLNILNTIAKVRDWTHYNLSLLTAATAEGSFEANSVMNEGKEQLAQKFYEQYGRSPVGVEALELDSLAKDAADVTMAANIALLYFNNRLTWGSLFKPGKVAQQEVIDGTFRNISKNTLEQNAKTGLYAVIKTTPETRVGKLLLNITKPSRFMLANISESFEEGAQFIISEGTLDYASRRYDAQSRGEVADYMKSFYAGLNKTFKTNEGWDNIIGGFVGGMLGGAVRSRIEKTQGVVNSPLKRLQQQADLMNSEKLNGLFEHKVQEAAINNSLAKDYKKAVEQGDVFKANNLKHDMLFNYVASAIKANRFDMRIDELEAAKGLTGEEFQKMWGQNYTDETGTTAAEYLDTVIEKAKLIKKDVDKINRLWRSNPFDAKKQSNDYVAYDGYKDELARNLSMSREYQKRLKNVESDLKALLPGIDTQRALEMTSLQGMRDMLTRLQTTMQELAVQEGQSQGNETLVTDLRGKRVKLKELFDELQPQVLNGFNAKTFVKTLDKLYKYYTGIDDTNNNFIEDRKRLGEANTIYLDSLNDEKRTDEELADALEQLQDIRKLAGANFGSLRFYNYLQTPVGQREFTDKFKALYEANLAAIVTDENGRTLTPEELENQVEEEVRFNTGTPADVEDTTSEERETLRKAAKKTVAGEELTPEEKAATDAKPVAFTNEVKVQDLTKKTVNARTGKATSKAENTDAEKVNSGQFQGIDPRNVFGLFSADRNDVAYRTNLYNAIFKSPLGGVISGLKAFFVKPEPPNIKYDRLSGTQLYRSSFTENIVINHNDANIGILRPANSVWLDSVGRRSVYDLKEDEYVATTGNAPATYAAFMAAIKAYQTQYNKLLAATQATDGVILTADQIKQYFDPTISTGNRVQHNDPRKDTILKDLNYKPQGTALISFVETVVATGNGQASQKTDEPAIVNADELTAAQLADLQAFIDANLPFLQKNFRRYIVALPINGKYTIQGMVAARNAETSSVQKEEYYKAVKDVAAGVYDEEALGELIFALNQRFFLANADRAIKQTFIVTTFTNNGDLILQINNPTLKVYKQIFLAKEVIQETKDYYDLITKLQANINSEAVKDKGFKQLQVTLDEQSLKQQLPTDTKVDKLSDIEDRLKLATTADVFENYTIHFNPITSAQTGTTTTQPNAPVTPSKDALIAEAVKAAATEITIQAYRDGFLSDPENGLKEAAQQLNSSESEAKTAEQVYGATISRIAKQLFPNETVENSTIDYITPAKNKLTNEYQEKRRTLDSVFQANLTDADRRIKEAITTSPSLATDQVKLLAAANVTQADVNSYSTKIGTFNENFNLLKDIERQRIANLTNTVTNPVFAKSKEGIKTIMMDLFGLTPSQAVAVAEVYELNAKAWSQRMRKPVDQFYKTLGFKSNLTPDAASNDILAQNTNYYKAVQDVAAYLKLEFKKIGANFGGWVSQKQGLTGKKLADRIGAVIKEKELENTISAAWDRTHNVVVFRNISPQNVLFQKPTNNVDITPTLASNDSTIEPSSKETLDYLEQIDGFGKLYSTSRLLTQYAITDSDILNQDARGAYNTLTNVIYALTDPNISTPLHELAHAWENKLTAKERTEVLAWADTADWTRETSEKFARGFENYLAEGKAPVKGLQKLFDKFAKWLQEVYTSLKAAFGDVQLNDSMRGIYARMLGENFEQDVEQAANPVAPAPQTAVEQLNTPLTEAQREDFGLIGKIQQALQDGYYQQAIANKILTEQQVRTIFTSAGIGTSAVDRIMFTLSNTNLIEKLAADIPAGVNVQYLRSDVSKAIKDGRFIQALETGVLDAEKAKQILDYFGINWHWQGYKGLKEAIDKAGQAPVVPSQEADVVEPEPEVTTYDDLVDSDVFEPTEEVTQPDNYVQYTEVGVTRYAKVVENQGLITVLEHNGTQFDKLTDRLTAATQAQYEATLPQATQVADAKYKIGDKVEYGENNDVYTISGAKQVSRPVRRKQNIGGVVSTEEQDSSKIDVIYETEEGVDIIETGIKGKARLTEAQKIQTVRKEHTRRLRVLSRIAERFQKLFPQIKYEIGYFDFTAPARFYKGTVQINVAFENKLSKDSKNQRVTREGDIFLKRETVAHEFMHPFVLALKNSNTQLYNSLIKELNKTQPELIDEVNKLIDAGVYTEDNKNDEALVVYLGRQITKAFDKDGILDEEYAQQRKNNLLTRFFAWLQDLFDFITGRKKPVTLDEFIQRVNSDVDSRKNDIRKQIISFEFLKAEYSKKYSNKIERAIPGLAKEYQKLGFEEFANKYGITDEQALAKLTDALDDYTSQKATGKFQFSVRSNENYGVEFEEGDDQVKVYIDPELVQDMSAAAILEQYGDRLTDNDLTEEYKDLVRRNFYKRGDREGDNSISVKHINPFMRLEDVSDFLITQLSDSGNANITYTGDELTGIDELEAYMQLTDPEAKKQRERIIRKLNALKDISTRRLGSESLQLQYNVINKLNLDETDIDFVLKYIEQGTVAINQAWRKYNEIRQDLDNPATLNREKLNRLGKELEVVKQLIGFYDDVTKLYNSYDDMFDEQQLSNFRKATVNVDRIRESMARTAADLATEWLYPYIEKNNEYLAKQGYVDAKYTVTREDFRNNLLYGTNKDVGFLTFQLGALVTSRDPVNAAFANTISDAIHLNHVDINETISDYMSEYTNWLKRTGLSNTNEKGQIEFYEKHYMRKAKLWTVVDFDNIKNEPVYGYVEKSALHQDYLYDEIDDAVRKYKLGLPLPKTSDEWDDQLVKVEAYRKSIKQNFVNPQYAKLQADRYFKFIEGTYAKQNDKYGKDNLQYGIIPQLYRGNSIKQAAAKYAQALREGNIKQNLELVSQKVGDKLANLQEDTTAINLDGTVYRVLNKELTNLKDDAKVEKNLQVSMVDFIIDASRYSSLKEIQFQAENLRMLIEGNTKFNVTPRKIGSEDLIGGVRDRRALKVAKEKLKQLEALKQANDPTFNQGEYDVVKAKVDKGIKPRSVWDKFLPRLKAGQTEKLNTQLSEMLNDVFYGESEYRSDLKVGNKTINLNKVGAALGMYTSISSMAFNRVAGLANVLQGNTQIMIEAFGGKHYNLKDVAWATAHYSKNTIKYVADLKNPIHSKDTQLALKFDAIQGEFEDEYGVKVSGNVMRRMLRPGSLFFMTKLGEHQIQMTGMLSLMHNYKVKTTKGESINLYDAYTADANGRYNLSKDVVFEQDEQMRFKRILHGINRTLNGNYNELHKGHLQRTWYGKQALRFRKWMYEGFRARWSSERVDYEKNSVEKGYLNYFFTDYLTNGIRQREFNLIKRYKDLTPDGKYRVRKASAEIAMFVLLTFVALGLKGDDDKELTEGEKAVLLFTLRLRGDLGTYHIEAPSEAAKMLDNPSASVNVAKKVIDVLIQLKRPNEVYERDYGLYKEGDNKLWAKFKKVIPVLNKAEVDWDAYLKYYSLIKRDVQ